LVGHREWWSAGRCFRPCVAPHQTCLSFNVTSAINTHLFVFLSTLRYLESTHRPSHNIGTLAYTHEGAHNTCTFSLHTDRPTMTVLSFYRNGPTTLATSIYAQTVPRYWSLPPTHSWSTIPLSADCRSKVFASKATFQATLLSCALCFCVVMVF